MRRLVVLCVVAAAVLVGPAGAVSGPEVCLFEDVAESGQSLPLDVQSVTVERSGGVIAFDVFFAEPFTDGLPEGSGFQVAIDSDRDRTTGGEDGDDYRLVAVQHKGASKARLAVWDADAGDWTEIGGVSFAVIEQSDRGVRFEVDEVELGLRAAFAFWVLAGTEWTSGDPVADLAPSDGKTSGAWLFPDCDYVADRTASNGSTSDGSAGGSGIFGERRSLPMLPILFGALAAITLFHAIIEGATGRHPSPVKLKGAPPAAVVAVTPLAAWVPAILVAVLADLAANAAGISIYDGSALVLIGLVVVASGLTSGRWWISTIPLGIGVAVIPFLLLASLMEEGRLPTANDFGLYFIVFTGWATLVAVGSLTRWAWTATHPHPTAPTTPSSVQPSH